MGVYRFLHKNEVVDHWAQLVVNLSLAVFVVDPLPGNEGFQTALLQIVVDSGLPERKQAYGKPRCAVCVGRWSGNRVCCHYLL